MEPSESEEIYVELGGLSNCYNSDQYFYNKVKKNQVSLKEADFLVVPYY